MFFLYPCFTFWGGKKAPFFVAFFYFHYNELVYFHSNLAVYTLFLISISIFFYYCVVPFTKQICFYPSAVFIYIANLFPALKLFYHFQGQIFASVYPFY